MQNAVVQHQYKRRSISLEKTYLIIKLFLLSPTYVSKSHEIPSLGQNLF